MIKFSSFQLNDEARYSLTRPFEAQQISNYISEKLISIGKSPNECSILDGMACVGGDTVFFLRYFKSVTSVEINESNYKLLLENIKTIKDTEVKRPSAIKTYNMNILDFIENSKENFDVIYLDPEWGGVSYKTQKEVFLKISGIPIENIIEKILESFKEQFFLVLKVPLNVNSTSFSKYIKEIIPIYNKLGTNSFNIILLMS
jgi:16S rRNA G966 N2-methylase RsmD